MKRLFQSHHSSQWVITTYIKMNVIKFKEKLKSNFHDFYYYLCISLYKGGLPIHFDRKHNAEKYLIFLSIWIKQPEFLRWKKDKTVSCTITMSSLSLEIHIKKELLTI